MVARPALFDEAKVCTSMEFCEQDSAHGEKVVRTLVLHRMIAPKRPHPPPKKVRNGKTGTMQSNKLRALPLNRRKCYDGLSSIRIRLQQRLRDFEEGKEVGGDLLGCPGTSKHPTSQVPRFLEPAATLPQTLSTSHTPKE